METKLKMVKSGSIIEFFNYKNGWLNYGSRPKNINKKYYPKKSLSASSIRYQKQLKLQRLINSNAYISKASPKLLTLTYKQNQTNLQLSKSDFNDFLQRLNYQTNSQLKYIAVPEFQKRGAVHFHTILLNVPYLPQDKIYSCWGKGFIKINRIDRINNVGVYMSKYLSKSPSSFNKKSYLSSQGLNFPIIDYNESSNRVIYNAIPSRCCIARGSYKTEFQGLVESSVFKLPLFDKGIKI